MHSALKSCSTVSRLFFPRKIKLREKNIEVNKKFCTDLHEVPAYVGELNQVWTNLIDNAIFAMEKNGKLTIETHCDNKNITVSVIDDGTGIPKEIVNRIFDPFFTTNAVGKGTGQGLSISHSVIYDLHGGEISVASQPGTGTVFTITLPIDTESSAEEKDEL